MAARGGYLYFLGEDGSPLPGALETVHVRILLDIPGAPGEALYTLNRKKFSRACRAIRGRVRAAVTAKGRM